MEITVGMKIRSYDFLGVNDAFVEGVVKAVDKRLGTCTIDVERDALTENHGGTFRKECVTALPGHTFMEYEGRIQIL